MENSCSLTQYHWIQVNIKFSLMKGGIFRFMMKSKFSGNSAWCSNRHIVRAKTSTLGFNSRPFGKSSGSINFKFFHLAGFERWTLKPKVTICDHCTITTAQKISRVEVPSLKIPPRWWVSSRWRIRGKIFWNSGFFQIANFYFRFKTAEVPFFDSIKGWVNKNTFLKSVESLFRLTLW